MSFSNRKLAICFVFIVFGLATTAQGASGAVWRHGVKALEEYAEIHLSGGSVLVVSEGLVSCEAAMTITIEEGGGDTGLVTKFQLENCASLEGSVECEVLETASKSLPWDVHVNGEDLTITGMRTFYAFDEGCPLPEYLAFSESATVALDNPSAISTMEYLRGEEFTEAAFFSVDEPNAGTYGVG